MNFRDPQNWRVKTQNYVGPTIKGEREKSIYVVGNKIQ